MTLVVGGYTAAPSEPAARRIYYTALAGADRAGGLELSWNETSSFDEIVDLATVLPDHWAFTLNAIPRTSQLWAKDDRFGLASPHEEGRTAAVELVRSIVDTVRRLNDRLGRTVVSAVEIHGAPGFSPRTVAPNASALARSLDAVAGLAWEGTAVLLEHCDAHVVGQEPNKGFLPLDIEIDTLRRVAGGPIGLSLNWGRSFLELRNAAGVLEQVRVGQASGLLRAFSFSGSSGQNNPYGPAWKDSHLPFADPQVAAYGEPASAMTRQAAADCLAAMSDLLFVAVKTNWPAARPDPQERAASVLANFDTVVDLIDRTGDPALFRGVAQQRSIA